MSLQISLTFYFLFLQNTKDDILKNVCTVFIYTLDPIDFHGMDKKLDFFFFNNFVQAKTFSFLMCVHIKQQ